MVVLVNIRRFSVGLTAFVFSLIVSFCGEQRLLARQRSWRTLSF